MLAQLSQRAQPAYQPICESRPAASCLLRCETTAHAPPAIHRRPSALSLASAALPKNSPSHSAQTPRGTTPSSALAPPPLHRSADVLLHTPPAAPSNDPDEA